MQITEKTTKWNIQSLFSCRLSIQKNLHDRKTKVAASPSVMNTENVSNGNKFGVWANKYSSSIKCGGKKINENDT